MAILLFAALVLSAGGANVPSVPFAPGAPGESAAEVVGFSPAHRVAWVERRSGSAAILRVVDLANDKVLAERPWEGDGTILAHYDVAPVVPAEVLVDPVRLVSDLHEYRVIVDGRDLRVRRLQTTERRLDWKKVGTTRSAAARVRGWVKSPFERRAAVLVDDQGLRVVGVHLDAGYGEKAPVTGRGLYEEALLARENKPEMEECAEPEEAARVFRFLAPAVAADRGLVARAKEDFPAYVGTLSFRVASGEVDLRRPGAVASALESTSWAFTSASCGGGLYSGSPSFSGGVFSVSCPQVQFLEGEERDEAERAEKAAARRFRVEGTTLVFEDGTRWELSVSDGVASISGGSETFVESLFACDAGA
ncbi:MAG TPA: hypothetical protein VF912_18415 [Anaeromyxobacter sp.]